MTSYIARIREFDRKTQRLREHLQEVAELTSSYASKIQMPASGKLIGLVHDLGKFSSDFQNYISGFLADPGSNEYKRSEFLKGKIDHSGYGAAIIWKYLSGQTNEYTCLAQILAACVMGHHSGLPDFLGPKNESPFLARLERQKLEEGLEKKDEEIFDTIDNLLLSSDLISEIKQKINKNKLGTKSNSRLLCFALGLLTRYLFSCLVDADRISAANFDTPKLKQFRQNRADWKVFAKKLEDYLHSLETDAPINQVRTFISNACLSASTKTKGLFRLSVPTGGGKTLSSLRFAINHALHHSQNIAQPIERIIYVIPFTTIIEQNAAVIRSVLGDENVLEHHSNLIHERIDFDLEWRHRVLTENWDSPVVLTTSVQFLNAFYSSSTSDARRLHHLANSVIIFDEVQSLPIHTIHLFNNAVNFLVNNCHSTAVLCTATQPLLSKDGVEECNGAINIPEENEIVNPHDPQLQQLKRNEIINKTKPEGWCDQEIAKCALELVDVHQSVLVIVNTKKSAITLYEVLKQQTRVKIYHLSTFMCPVHRKKILNEIRDGLCKGSAPFICVSTQLIEAGVDVDFGAVIRYLAGLDSIIQAAGRCNRHGKRAISPVIVLNPINENLENLPEIYIAQQKMKRILAELPEADLCSSSAIHMYYKYYYADRKDKMIYPINPKNNPEINRETNLLNLLSDNMGFFDSYKRVNRIDPPFVLFQSFASASNAFSVIHAPTNGVIVPYGCEGKELINQLCSQFNNTCTTVGEKIKLLKQAQRFSVNLYPQLLKNLFEVGCIYQVNDTLPLYCLREQHYSEAIGLTLNEQQEMEFLNL